MSDKKLSNSMLNYIMKWLIFVLMVSALAQSIIVSLILPVSFATVLGMAAILYLVLSLYFFNRLVSIALLLTTLSSIGIYIRYFASEVWWNETVNFLKWLLDYALGIVPVQSQYITPSAWLIVFILSIVVYIFVIKLEWIIVPFILCTGIITTEWMLGHSQIITWLWPLALAWVLLLSSKYYRKLSRHHNMPDYGLWQISTLPLAIAVVVTSSALLPHDTQNLKWEFLERTVQDISDRWSNRSVFTSPRQPFRLSQTGFPSSSEQLGGPVKISDDVVLKITSTAPLYLRGSILNDYTGKGWVDSIDDRRYKFNSSYWEGIGSETFDWDEPIWKDLNHDLRARFFPPVKASITHIGIETSVLFNSHRLEDITVQRWGSFTPYFNGKSETFTSRNILASEGYMLHVTLPNIADQMFQDYLNDYIPLIDWHQPIPQALSWDDINREKLLNIQKHYTAVPENIPDRVADLAVSIVRDIKTPLGKALAIQAYLQQNYAYTLYPPYTPDNVDFVDYFLFELKKGYCTYFATAMAVMGRIIGLPTRYIEGFLMPSQPVEQNLYEVRKLNGHAWVEIYFPKVGWLTFDPTPAAQHQYFANGQQPSQYYDLYREEFLYPWQQYNNMAEYDFEFDVEPTSPFISSSRYNTHPFIVIGASIFIIVCTVLISLKLWDALRWKKIKKLPHEQQLNYYYQQILWLFTLYGFPMHYGETPVCLC